MSSLAELFLVSAMISCSRASFSIFSFITASSSDIDMAASCAQAGRGGLRVSERREEARSMRCACAEEARDAAVGAGGRLNRRRGRSAGEP